MYLKMNVFLYVSYDFLKHSFNCDETFMMGFRYPEKVSKLFRTKYDEKMLYIIRVYDFTITFINFFTHIQIMYVWSRWNFGKLLSTLPRRYITSWRITIRTWLNRNWDIRIIYITLYFILIDNSTPPPSRS